MQRGESIVLQWVGSTRGRGDVERCARVKEVHCSQEVALFGGVVEEGASIKKFNVDCAAVEHVS